MQVPIRKSGKYTFAKPDPHLTEAKLLALKHELEKLKHAHPQAAAEMKRLAEMGDFSENAAYAMAKGRLRGINQRILELEDQLKHAKIIPPAKGSTTVQLGSRVTIESDGIQKTYLILGPAETDPSQGIISHRSPIGAALMEHSVGDMVTFLSGHKNTVYKIIKIE